MDYVKDVLLTDRYMVKCFINTGERRLSDFLSLFKRDFLPLNNVTMIDLRDGRAVSSHEAMVRKDDVVVAHELLDLSGDSSMKQMHSRDAWTQNVDMIHSGIVDIEISGLVRQGSLERSDGGTGFFVIREAALRGVNVSLNPELKILTSLPYLIVNRKQISLVMTHCS